MNKIETQMIKRPSSEPVLIANNANLALYKYCRELRKYAIALEEKVAELERPKLKIPKYIAESLEKVAKAHQIVHAMHGDVFGVLDAADWLVTFCEAGSENVMNPELYDYLSQDKSGHIETCMAFLNPLTRQFVEVVD